MKTIKINRKMESYLDAYAICQYSHLESSVPKGLLEIIKDGILERDGAYFFKSNVQVRNNVSANDFIDLTGYECFINEVIIDDFMEDAPIGKLVHTSYCFLRLVEQLLYKQNQKFAIIWGVQEDEFITANIRFHKIREDELYLESNLDDFMEEAIFLEEIDPR